MNVQKIWPMTFSRFMMRSFGLCKPGHILDQKGHSKETRIEGMSY
jgi:hypothetical protein